MILIAAGRLDGKMLVKGLERSCSDLWIELMENIGGLLLAISFSFLIMAWRREAGKPLAHIG